MSGMPDILIAGGGVVGCAIAYALARRGAAVTLVERDRIGAEASSAAAGMLAPLAEAFGPSAPRGEDAAAAAFIELAVASLRRFPTLVAALRETTGIDPGLIEHGMIRIFDAPPAAEKLDRLLAIASNHELGVDLLDARDLSALQPGLAPSHRWGVRSRDEHQLEAPTYVQALAAAARAHGATVLEGVPLTGIRAVGDRVTALVTPGGDLSAGRFVFALGAWSNVVGEWLDLTIPVQPARGQILSVRNTIGLRHTIFGPRGYLVPKWNGTIVVGATEEAAGYEKRVTVRGLATILGNAAGTLPEIDAAPIVATWSGLRPGTPDHLPILGQASGWSNAYLATGHYRNGILLSAITGEALADLVEGRPPAVDLAAFGVGRFNAVRVGT